MLATAAIPGHRAAAANKMAPAPGTERFCPSRARGPIFHSTCGDKTADSISGRERTKTTRTIHPANLLISIRIPAAPRFSTFNSQLPSPILPYRRTKTGPNQSALWTCSVLHLASFRATYDHVRHATASQSCQKIRYHRIAAELPPRILPSRPPCLPAALPFSLAHPVCKF